MSDLEYYRDGPFTKFMPNTKEGEDAWSVMATQLDGNAAILTIHEKQVLRQLRKAGYKVSKMKKSTQKLDEILAELDM